jgi:hypothetical protein
MRELGAKARATVVGAWLLALVGSGEARAEAQAPGSALGYQRVDAYLEATLAKSGLGEVNRALRQRGYSPLDQRSEFLGAGFGVTLERVRLTFDAEYEPWERVAQGGSDQDSFAQTRMSVMGGPELRLGEFFFSPLVGGSIGVATLDFAAGRAPFLAKPAGPTASSLSRDVITLDLALAADYALARWGSSSGAARRKTYAPVVGLRFGYHWQAWSSDWYRGLRRFSGGPDTDLGGVFGRIVLGWECESGPRPAIF